MVKEHQVWAQVFDHELQESWFVWLGMFLQHLQLVRVEVSKQKVSFPQLRLLTSVNDEAKGTKESECRPRHYVRVGYARA